MKYSILGFNQLNIVKLGLDLDEVLILRYFIDFKDSGRMIKRTIGEDTYYWINYDSLKESLPILNISKDRVYRKLKKLANEGILRHTTIKEGGTFSYYTVGPKYISLIDSDFEENSEVKEIKSSSKDEEKVPDKCKETTVEIPEGTLNLTEGSVKMTEGYGKNTLPGTVKIPEGYGENTGTNNSSIKYISIKNNSSNKDIYMAIIEYLNEKSGTSYKTTSKKTRQLISARLNEGFNLEDFKTVIDKKAKEWLGSEFSKYLRPETLFGTKFEGYLNQKAVAISTNKNSVFNNCSQRSYDGSDGCMNINDLERKLLGWDR